MAVWSLVVMQMISIACISCLSYSNGLYDAHPCLKKPWYAKRGTGNLFNFLAVIGHLFLLRYILEGLQ